MTTLPPTDAQLLARYVADRDDLAFGQLVRKHGPMVLGVCRRIAPHWHDAEDAFQACFLVLAARADTVRPPARLGAWLHGVATRCARKARRLSRRATPDHPLPDLPSPARPDLEPDVAPLLDEALAAIPDQYRAAVVLCHLQGRTRAEAARELGWSEGTLSGRLHRALALLAKRLAARGVTAPAAVLAAVSTRAALATVPVNVLASTQSAAALLGAGLPDAPHGTATALAHGVMRTMSAFKLKLAACLLLFCAGVGLLALENLAVAQPDAPRAARRNAPVPGDGKQAWKEVLTLKHPAALTAVAVGKDRLATADEYGSVHLRVWDATTGKYTRGKQGPSGDPSPDKPIRWIQVLRDGRTALVDGEEDGGTVYRTDLADDQGASTGAGFRGIRFVGTSADGTLWLAVSVKTPGLATLYPNVIDNPKAKPMDIRVAGDALLITATLAADATRLATVTADGLVHVHDRATGKDTQKIRLPEGTTITALKLTDDGKRLAVIGEKGFAVLFDATTGKELCDLKGHIGTVTAVAFTPDGKGVATANGKVVRVFDAATGKLLGEITGHTDEVTCLAFSPDGKRLLTGSRDKTAKVWERK